ncbi:MAG: hypothetical protein MRZ54_11850 [Clostridiales bacterium]|nr:hypothetical protein [Clostridiales bacterium]
MKSMELLDIFKELYPAMKVHYDRLQLDNDDYFVAMHYSEIVSQYMQQYIEKLCREPGTALCAFIKRIGKDQGNAAAALILQLFFFVSRCGEES